MRGFRHACLLCLCLIVFSAPVHAAQHPKIGVCLSGGGARGAAHVGVLRVLEQLHVPVDCIAGTSMGAIVGGLYASGLSLDEIERVGIETNWNAVFSGRIPRDEIPYQDKQGQKNYILDMNVDFSKGIMLPMGLIQGQRLDFMLRSLTLGVADIRDFDNLPIPFRAVATDILSSQPVVLSHGDLARAMRASMAVPGVFTPVEFDGKLLVDGGVSMNLPVEVMRNMGADIIIAVNIGSPLLKKGQINNVFDITDQITRFLTNSNIRVQVALLGKRDILIKPDLDGIGSADFKEVAEAIEIGEGAAEAFSALIGPYSLSPQAYRKYCRLHHLGEYRPPKIEFIEVDKPARFSSRSLRRRLENRMQNFLKVDMDVLGYDLFKAYELEGLEYSDFRLVERNGRQGLFLKTKKKPHAPGRLCLGLRLSNDFEGGSGYGLLVDYTKSHLNDLGGKWKTEMEIGERQTLRTEFYQPFDPYMWAVFISPYAGYEKYYRDIFYRDSRVARYRIRKAALGIDLGMQLSRFGEIRIGLMRGRNSASVHTGDLSLADFGKQQGAYVTSLHIDQLDDLDFPRRGLEALCRYKASRTKFGADDSFEVLDAEIIKPFTFRRHTLIARTRLGTSLGSSSNISERFSLGGFLNLSGLCTDQLTGQHMFLGQLIYYHRIWAPMYLPLDSLYLGTSFEGGNVWDKRSEVNITAKDMIFASSMFVGAKTAMGPIFLGLGHAEDNRTAMYFMLGHLF
ncbi:MAG: patatin-like phospholipase family protein [Thermodesulfobacteriota bacterium]|nr:patatin-like phospholipase family protein [Thermodesulfobacteriota bacterium]